MGLAKTPPNGGVGLFFKKARRGQVSISRILTFYSIYLDKNFWPPSPWTPRDLAGPALGFLEAADSAEGTLIGDFFVYFRGGSLGKRANKRRFVPPVALILY